MKTFLTLSSLLAATLFVTPTLAQTKAAPKLAAKAPPAKAASANKPAATVSTATASAASTPAPAPLALVTDKMEAPAANTSLLKVQTTANPITGRLTVRTNSPNPTRVELNGPGGRPVVTRDLLGINDVAILDVSNLPPGAYIVECTSGERRGVKRVMVGQ